MRPRSRLASPLSPRPGGRSPAGLGRYRLSESHSHTGGRWTTLVLVLSALGMTAVAYLFFPTLPPDPAALPSIAPSQLNTYVPAIQDTRYVKGVTGTTLWEDIYLRDGVWIVVASPAEVEDMPPVGDIMCDTPLADRRHPPATDGRIRFLPPDEARVVLGPTAVRQEGLSVFFNDEPGPSGQSFLHHYYHFGKSSDLPETALADDAAEVFLSAWRLVNSAYGVSDLPERLMFRTTPDDWRDPAGLTVWWLQTVMPRTVVEDAPVWDDRRRSGTTYIFDRLVIVDRFAAHNNGPEVRRWNKMTAELPDLPVLSTWMDPLRASLRRAVVSSGCTPERSKPDVPVVTYINRQKTSRRLVDENAASLLSSLQELHDEDRIELYDAFMEDMPRVDQFCLALKTDILVGVHGNGLSHQLWMDGGGAVIELMAPGGFALDYALPADLMGHEYHAVQNDTTLPREEWVRPDGKPVQQGPDFHSDHLPVHAPFVAQLVARLAEERSVSESDLHLPICVPCMTINLL